MQTIHPELDGRSGEGLEGAVVGGLGGGSPEAGVCSASTGLPPYPQSPSVQGPWGHLPSPAWGDGDGQAKPGKCITGPVGAQAAPVAVPRPAVTSKRATPGSLANSVGHGARSKRRPPWRWKPSTSPQFPRHLWALLPPCAPGPGPPPGSCRPTPLCNLRSPHGIWRVRAPESRSQGWSGGSWEQRGAGPVGEALSPRPSGTELQNTGNNLKMPTRERAQGAR